VQLRINIRLLGGGGDKRIRDLKELSGEINLAESGIRSKSRKGREAQRLSADLTHPFSGERPF
jgi:hypothetical protein